MKKYWWLFISITAAWFIYAIGMLVLKCITHTSIAQAGQIGDTFGALNALFSGLAFAGLIISIRQQQEEIKKATDAQQSAEVAMKAQTQLMSHSALLNGYTTYLDYLNTCIHDIRQGSEFPLAGHDEFNALNELRAAHIRKIEAVILEIDSIRKNTAL